MAEHGVVNRIGISKGVVTPKLLVAPRVVQERRGQRHLARFGQKALALRNQFRVPDDKIGVDALQAHHRRQLAVRLTIRINIRIVQLRQFLQHLNALCTKHYALSTMDLLVRRGHILLQLFLVGVELLAQVRIGRAENLHRQ